MSYLVTTESLDGAWLDEAELYSYDEITDYISDSLYESGVPAVFRVEHTEADDNE